MQADEAQETAEQRGTRTLRLGPVGVVGVVFGLSIPLTSEIGMVVALLMALALACMRRWSAMGVVLGAAAVGIAAWLLFTAVVTDDGGEGEAGCPDGRTIQAQADQVEDLFTEPSQEKIERFCATN